MAEGDDEMHARKLRLRDANCSFESFGEVRSAGLSSEAWVVDMRVKEPISAHFYLLFERCAFQEGLFFGLYSQEGDILGRREVL